MIFQKKTTNTATSDRSSLADTLDLSKAVADTPAPEGYFDQLQTELRISKAVFDTEQGRLNVNGWCLTPENTFDLFLTVPGTRIVTQITPNTEPRPDVFQTYPQYGNKTSGWNVSLPLSNLPEDACIRASYLSDDRRQVFEKEIIRKDATSPQARPTSLRIKSCIYSPLRSTCTIIGEMTSAREDLAFTASLSDGSQVRNLRWSVSPPNNKGIRNLRLNFQAAGVRTKETVTVSETRDSTNTRTVPLEIGKDSPLRKIATTASVHQDITAPDGCLSLEGLQGLRVALSGLDPVEKQPSEVCYFPAFEDKAALANHVHRASWYLTGTGSPISKINFGGMLGKTELPPTPAHLATRGLDMASIDILTNDDRYLAALQRAGTVMIWQPLPQGLKSYLSDLLGGANLLTIATDDPSAVEYGNYCRGPWDILPAAEKLALLQESQDRFRHVLDVERAAGKTCSAVFGTGPSIDQAFDFDFSDCMTVACNSIVANEALLDHIRPTFICAGDAVSHFGVSQYAETFRADLVQAIQTRGVYFLTSAAIGFLLLQKHPEVRDHIILCEQGITGLNCDLETVWSLPKFDSTLNIHMFPIATSFSDTIYMLGLDGRDPTPANNEDFWAHSKAAQYHDLVDSGHLAHPTFAINRARATEERYLASVQESLMAGEALGKTFYALAPSFTPAIHARPVQPHCFVPTEKDRTQRKLRAIPRAAPPRSSTHTGKRALIVSQITRRYFSGGRYHGTMLAEALAGFCDEVVIWTNNMPPWSGDLAACPDHGRVTYWINDFVTAPEGSFDYVILLPDGSQDPHQYFKALDIARTNNARVVFVNFESPNWFNALSPQPKVLAEMDNWFATGCFSDIILSSAQTAVPFAEHYYQPPFHTPLFAVAPPSINSPIANLVRQNLPPKEKQVILISRFGSISAHKNIDAIFDCITPEMSGYTLALIAGTAPLPEQETLDAFRARLSHYGMSLKLLYMISDREKYEEIAKSELMIFPSLFEGFGYPPVEAGYMGTPCIAYDLPVLAEFNADHAYLVPWGNTQALRDQISDLLHMPPEARIRSNAPAVLKTASLENFSRTLENILTTAPPASAAARFSPQTFELMRKLYLDRLAEPELSVSTLGRTDVLALATHYQRCCDRAHEALEKALARSSETGSGAAS